MTILGPSVIRVEWTYLYDISIFAMAILAAYYIEPHTSLGIFIFMHTTVINL